MQTRALDFLNKYNLWHIVSDNPKAGSCRDASAKRKRLGSRGIPLYDELKTMGAKALIDGKESYLFLHCRANSYMDIEKAKKALGIEGEIERMEVSELDDKFEAVYGTVNPFLDRNDVVQVFDQDIFNYYTAPHTLMTNGGHLNIAIEFDPEELIDILKPINKQVLVEDIIQDTQNNEFFKMGIGIITGNGPESGMSLWKQINNHINDELTKNNNMHGDLSYPRVIVSSIPEMGLSMELDKREKQVWKHLKKAVIDLCQSDIHYLALACHTTQYFENDIRKICEEHDVVFYSISDVVLEHMQANNIDDLTIFAIPIVANLEKYSAYKKIKGLGFDVKPMDPIVENDIEELGYYIKTLPADAKSSKAINMLGSIIKKGRRGENSLIALTELSVLLDSFPKIRNKGHIADTKFIDGLDIYAKKYAQLYLDSLPKTKYDKSDSWG